MTYRGNSDRARKESPVTRRGQVYAPPLLLYSVAPLHDARQISPHEGYMKKSRRANPAARMARVGPEHPPYLEAIEVSDGLGAGPTFGAYSHSVVSLRKGW